MILIEMIGILLGGGILCWLTAGWNSAYVKWIAMTAVAADLLIAGVLFAHFSAGGMPQTATAPTAMTWLVDYRRSWIPSLGVSLHLSMDGLSLLLVLLTFFLGLLSVLTSWREIKERQGFYYFNLLWTLGGIAGVFLATDLFLFYFFWEVMLVPMYLLILLWGDSNRRYAAYKFFLFTQAGGLLMLLSILALYFIHGQQGGGYSFDYSDLLHTTPPPAVARWILLGFLAAFAVKLPVVPFHNWLPDAHSEAPTAGSLILAGLLLKTGAYGMIRFILPFFPQASAAIAPWAMGFGVIGILYGALLAFAQTDLKRLIAYTSVSHMGFVLLGIFAMREMALHGVVLQLLAHGISTGALFAVAGMIKQRLHTRDIGQMGGLWKAMPSMGGMAMIFAMASLGLPLLGNFIAEFLVLLGAFPQHVTLVVIASTGLVFSALYSLRMMTKVFFGPAVAPAAEDIGGSGALRDMDGREWLILGLLCIGIVLLGLFPQPIINMIKEQMLRL
jgi:NADH-quinone oxidoreductase subunit M